MASAMGAFFVPEITPESVPKGHKDHAMPESGQAWGIPCLAAGVYWGQSARISVPCLLRWLGVLCEPCQEIV